MKKLTSLAILLFLILTTVSAQSDQEELELFQSVFGMEKKAIVSEFIKVEGEQGKSFWSLYDAYETARKAHGQKRIALLNKYADEYLTLDDTSTDEIMKETIAMGNEYDKLINKYYKSIKKQCGSKTAAQFFQLETYFQSAVRKMIFESIPLIGELDN